MLRKVRRNACQSSVLTQPSSALSNRATLQSNSELSVFDSARLINFVGLQPLVIICRRRVRVRRRGDRVDARHGARPEVRCGEGVSARRRRRRAPRGDQVARVVAASDSSLHHFPPERRCCARRTGIRTLDSSVLITIQYLLIGLGGALTRSRGIALPTPLQVRAPKTRID